MPEAGTKRVVVAGEPTYLPADQAEVIQLLRDGCILQTQVKHLAEQLDAIKTRLADIAKRRIDDADTRTITLVSPNGELARVQFSQSYRVSGVSAEALRGELGDEWEDVFNRRVSYGLSRKAQAWLKRAPARLAKVVRASFKTVNRKPTVELSNAGE